MSEERLYAVRMLWVRDPEGFAEYQEQAKPILHARHGVHIERWLMTEEIARHTNDNALVESKNGSVVRKHLGYGHIPSRHAQRVNDFTQNVLSPYLNFHRPCFFPSETVDAKGRRRKRYRDADIMTPYEKLKSLPEAAVYLTPGTTFQQLDAVAFALRTMMPRAPCTRHAHGYSGLLTRLPDMSGSSIRFRLISGLERTPRPPALLSRFPL